MTSEVIILGWTAATVGFMHTVSGPDHYLPFIVLSKARGWGFVKTALVTFLCGIGHILSSIVLGFLGIAFGAVVFKLEAIEVFRKDIAAWLLIMFGFTYFVWGLHRAIRFKPHSHYHPHEDETDHSHSHSHMGEHSHIHYSKAGNMAPWVMFIIFIFGPCEPLIPIIMYPAAKHNILAAAVVAFIFGAATIFTMLSVVLVSSFGLSRLPVHRLERYSHALAGLAIFLCGAVIKFLGL